LIQAIDEEEEKLNPYDIYRQPDAVTVQTESDWINLSPAEEQSSWQNQGVSLRVAEEIKSLRFFLKSPKTPIMRVRIRWNQSMSFTENTRILNDHWERGYGDLEWRGLVPERILPWYFMISDGKLTHGYGVKTGCSAICFWQADDRGVTLWLDVRNGGAGVHLSDRELFAAEATFRPGKEGETPYQSAKAFCNILCSKPLLPSQPIYGGNNWYYAYGNSSNQEILDDSKRIVSFAPSGSNRPFMVIDDGWQICHASLCNGGPWTMGNYRFPDMARLAADMKDIGVRPGIWMRPLMTAEKVPADWVMTNIHRSGNTESQFLDPSQDGVMEWIARDIHRIVSWGYEMIKHDFSTYDIFGKWGFEMSSNLTKSGWSFRDRSKTTAEIILNLYRTIREAAGSTLVLGCNTVGHLAAGLFELQRTGDDTSGRDWERTRKYGINTLAFRMPQHGAFFAADADCVGLTRHVPWALTRQWMELLANSGTPLFVSISPDAVGREQESALKEAFAAAASERLPAEPLDWFNNTCPSKWLINGETRTFDWYGGIGVNFYE
jgi:alpha-galactosidase